MNYTDILGLLAGLLQLAVACYALRLSWRFGTARVGWLIFGAFILLAFFHSLLAINPFRVGLESGIIPDVAYAIVSILLLVSIVRLEASLKLHWQTQRDERRNLSEWENEVESQVAELTKANEELRRIGTKLQVEAAGQKQICEQTEQTFQGLLAAARQTEKDLLQTISTMLAEAAEQKQKLLLERQTGRSEAAAAILESLNTLDASARGQVKSRTSRIVRASRLARVSSPRAVKPGPQRKKLPESLAQLARNLSGDQFALLQEIESLKSRFEQIKATGAIITAPQPSPAATTETPGDLQAHIIENVTETGTEGTASPDSPAAAETSKTIVSKEVPA